MKFCNNNPEYLTQIFTVLILLLQTKQQPLRNYLGTLDLTFVQNNLCQGSPNVSTLFIIKYIRINI